MTEHITALSLFWKDLLKDLRRSLWSFLSFHLEVINVGPESNTLMLAQEQNTPKKLDTANCPKWHAYIQQGLICLV